MFKPELAVARVAPPAVLDAIRDHLDARMPEANYAYRAARKTEDTITGDFWGNLRMTRSEVIDPGTGKTWEWSLTYKKVGSAGDRSTEKQLGADGVINLFVRGPTGVVQKGVLFQAKRDWTTRNQRLVEQLDKMQHWERAAIVLNYTKDGTEVFEASKVRMADGRHQDAGQPLTAQVYLLDMFAMCAHGARDLYYHADEDMLFWASGQGTVGVPFAANHSVSLTINEPGLEARYVIDPGAETIELSKASKYPVRTEGLHPVAAARSNLRPSEGRTVKLRRS